MELTDHTRNAQFIYQAALDQSPDAFAVAWSAEILGIYSMRSSLLFPLL